MVNEGSRSAPLALNEEPNPGVPQVTVLFKPQEAHYDLDAGDEDLASEKGLTVNGAGSDYGAVPACSSGNYWGGGDSDGEGVVSANGETLTQHSQDVGNSGSSNDEKGEDEESDCVVESDVSSDEASDEGDGGVGSSDDRSPAAQKPRNRNQTGRTQAVRDFLVDKGRLKRNGKHMENFLHENPNAGEKALNLLPALLMRVFELEARRQQQTG